MPMPLKPCNVTDMWRKPKRGEWWSDIYGRGQHLCLAVSEKTYTFSDGTELIHVMNPSSFIDCLQFARVATPEEMSEFDGSGVATDDDGAGDLYVRIPGRVAEALRKLGRDNEREVADIVNSLVLDHLEDFGYEPRKWSKS